MCSNSSFNQTCNVRCKAGFVGGGDSGASYVCGPEGKWVGNLVCSGVQCGRTVPNLDPNAVARCRGDTSFGGNVCTSRCRPGYDGNVSSYTCSQQGVWTTLLPTTCVPVECPATVDAELTHPHALPAGTCPDNKFDGTPCTVECVARSWAWL